MFSFLIWPTSTQAYHREFQVALEVEDITVSSHSLRMRGAGQELGANNLNPGNFGSTE
jgi:hypothetical protein